ncbi:nucleoside-diphosphate kinase, partial [Backusella circina FSU 941]
NIQNTLAIIKPDGMQGHKEAIIQKIKENGFHLVQEREVQLSKEQAGLFYREHEGKPFYQDLTTWMSSAPVYVMILQKEDAIQAWRTLMGPTDSNKARDVEPQSIRALFGTDGSHNATHGSDCVTSAEREIDIIFGQTEQGK